MKIKYLSKNDSLDYFELELVEQLVHLGFDSTSASVYLHLYLQGPSKMGTLCSSLGMDRNVLYRTLCKLKNQEMITSSFSNPPRYCAIEPKETLMMLLEKKEGEITIIRNLIERIEKVFNEYDKKTSTSEFPIISVVQSRRNVYARIVKLLNYSKHIVYLITTRRDLMRMYYTAIPDCAGKNDNPGFELRIITENDDCNTLDLTEKFNTFNIYLAKLPSKSRIVVAEDEQVIMSGSIDNSTSEESDSVLVTDSPEIVKNMYFFCDSLWKASASNKSKSH